MKNNQILKNFLIMFVCYLIDSVINYFIPTNINRSGLTFVPCIGLLMFSLLTITVHDKSERFSLVQHVVYIILFVILIP